MTVTQDGAAANLVSSEAEKLHLLLELLEIAPLIQKKLLTEKNTRTHLDGPLGCYPPPLQARECLRTGTSLTP
jgi:hypothetical protein